MTKPAGACRTCVDQLWIEAEGAWRDEHDGLPETIEDFDAIADAAIALIATDPGCARCAPEIAQAVA